MNKRGQIYFYLIIIAIIVGGWLIINNVYVSYKHEELGIYNSNYYTCENNTVIKTNNLGAVDTAKLACLAYTGYQKYKLSCENDIIMVTCYTTINNKFFATK